jgi:hypothetical protein
LFPSLSCLVFIRLHFFFILSHRLWICLIHPKDQLELTTSIQAKFHYSDGEFCSPWISLSGWINGLKVHIKINVLTYCANKHTSGVQMI